METSISQVFYENFAIEWCKTMIKLNKNSKCKEWLEKYMKEDAEK